VRHNANGGDAWGRINAAMRRVSGIDMLRRGGANEEAPKKIGGEIEKRSGKELAEAVDRDW